MSKNVKIITVTLLSFICLAVGFIAGSNVAYPVAYNDGVKVGYNSALVDVANLLQQKGVTLDWNQQADGSYILTVSTPNGQTGQITIVANLYLEWRDKDGNVRTSRGQGTFTTLGKNWTVQQLLYASTIAGFVSGGGTSGVPVPGNTGINATTAALYLGDATTAASTSTSTVQATETQANGMGRLQQTSAYYSAGTGGGTLGQFNVTATKTCTPAGQHSLEWGLYYRPYSATVSADLNSLIAYDSTPGDKNLAAGDTLTETWTVTIS